MLKKKTKKILISILIFMLSFTNIFTIIPDIINLSTYASSTNLEEQSTIIQNTNSNALFDVFFLDGSHSKAQNMSSEPIIAIDIQALSGTLSNITLSFRDLNNTTDVNYQLPTSITFDTFVPTVNTTNMSMNLNTTITNGTMRMQMPLRIYDEEDYKLEYLSQTSKVVLNATYTDDAGTQRTVSHEIQINLSWQETLVMEIGQRIERYIPYDIDGKKGVLVETAIVSKLNTEGMYSSLPIKQTNIQLTAPQFAGVNPTSVEVNATRLLATNGETEINLTFGTNNWSYNSSTRAINITVENKEVNGSLYVGRGSDEFIITYDYPEAAYNLVNPTNGVTFASNVTGTIQYYSGSTIETTTTTDNDTMILKEQIGILETGPMGKGHLYLNSVDPSNNIETPGQMTYSLHMTEGGNLATHAFVFDYNYFEDAAGNKYSTYVGGTPYIKYNSTKINKETFERVLGINGYIKIYDASRNYLGTINSSSQLDSEGYYIFNYTNTIGSVILETSLPIDFTNTIIVINDTTLLATLPYTRQQIREFTILASPVDTYSKLTTATNWEKGGGSVVELELKDTISNAYLSVTNSTLREGELNEDVIFNITLVNNNWEMDLFVNPIFQIDLPNYIEKLDIKNVYLSLGQYFTIKNKEAIKRADGGYSIRLELEGTQNRIYATPTQIQIITDITTKQAIPKLTQDLELLYYNEHAKNYKRETENGIQGLSQSITKVGLATSEIDFVGTNDLNCYCTITNFDNNNTEISSLSAPTVGNIEAITEAKTAKMNLNIVNGYINNCKNIIIIGRIPFQNNQYAISKQDLGSTFSTTLASQITTTNTDLADKMIVYYSENPDATTDLTLATNGWTTTYTAQNNFKSYLIVLSNYELASGNTLHFSYDFKIPENVGYEKEVYTNFGVYYTKETTQTSKETSKIGLKTQQKPQIELEKTVSVGNQTAVTEGDILKYTITVKNTGEIDAKNLEIKDTIPDGTTYVENIGGTYQKDTTKKEIIESIALLTAGQSQQIEFEVEVNEITESITTIKNVAIATIEGIEDPITSPETVNPVIEQIPELRLEKTVSVGNQTAVTEGDILKYTITVINTGETDAKNVEIKDTIPEGTTYVEKIDGIYQKDATKKEIIASIGLLPAGQSQQIEFEVEVNEITETITTIKNVATVTAKALDEPISSPETVNPVVEQIPELRLEKTVSVGNETEVTTGDILKYTITVINIGETDAKNVEIKDTIPEGTTYVEKIDGIYQKDTTKKEIIESIGLLPAGQSQQIEFEVEVNKITAAIKTIKNVAIVTAKGLEDPISSPETVNPIVQEYIKIIKTSSIAENTYIKEGEDFEYNFTIENISGQKLENVNVSDILPQGIEYIQGYNIENTLEPGLYTENTQNVTYNKQTRTVNWNIGTLESGQKVQLKLKVKAEEIIDNIEIRTIENKAKVTADGGISRTTPNIINHIANIDVDIVQDVNIERYRLTKNTTVTYTITLTNKSVIKLEELVITDTLSELVEYQDAYIIGENGEQIREGVQYNPDSRTVSWDINKLESQEDIQVEVVVTTKEPIENEEIFQNVASVSSEEIEQKKSNEIEKAVIKEGAQIETKFDLAIDKTIKSITVTNNSKTYTNTYDGTKMTKIDISERLLNETIVEIEYEIMVINQGNIPGYARKIIDYIPEGTIFNQQNNPNWTLENGKVYYTGLEDEIINPGENRTITIKLTKQVTEDNVGSIINQAEIYEDYNAEQADDINSTPNNKDEKENDYSKAELVISIRAGKENTNIELIISSLTILGIGIYLIKKKVI